MDEAARCHRGFATQSARQSAGAQAAGQAAVQPSRKTLAALNALGRNEAA